MQGSAIAVMEMSLVLTGPASKINQPRSRGQELICQIATSVGS